MTVQLMRKDAHAPLSVLPLLVLPPNASEEMHHLFSLIQKELSDGGGLSSEQAPGAPAGQVDAAGRRKLLLVFIVR